jgi:tRNA (adenine57-N1/adenine58-N1)-methyltransferase catalytic subunit
VLRRRWSVDDDGELTLPLSPGKRHPVNKGRNGHVNHDDIIGKSPRDIVQGTKAAWRLYEPTLEEYVRLTPRIVTPVSPSLRASHFTPRIRK